MNTEVETYLAQFSGETKSRLEELRKIIRTAAPDATESMRYGLIGYKLNAKPLIYVGGFRHHIGIYATPVAHEFFADQLAGYKRGKGSVQFPLDKPLPLKLIQQMVRFNVRHKGKSTH